MNARARAKRQESRNQQEWRYENNVPRCENCMHFHKPPRPRSEDGQIVKFSKIHKARCAIGGFRVSRNSCCDKWRTPSEVLAD